MIVAQRLIRRVLKPLVFARYQLVQKRRLKSLQKCEVLGRNLLIQPGVFHPVVFHSGLLFAEYLEKAKIESGSSVLDLGSGCGICAIVAADKCRRVVAVDRNPRAVECSRENARLNGLEDRIQVLCGDLFGSVCGERFDVVLFNPPFLKGNQLDRFAGAFRGDSSLPARFAADLDNHLRPRGELLLLLSEEGRPDVFLTALQSESFQVRQVFEKRVYGEAFRIFSATREGGQ